ncbi:MAG: polysaccharide deacetylase family protein [bacterium]|nr:polysaccharide deacetylase family protein [bacterium]
MMKSFIKDALFFLCGIGRAGLGDRASILMYHSVAENGAFFTVSPKEFERQMHYLHDSGRTVVPLAELCRRLKANESVGGLVAITFDDGYRDNYTEALPVLQRFGFHATVFVITDFIGKSDTRGMEHLNLAEMKAMEASGLVAIEPHTKSHPKLTQLPREEAREEIVGSKKAVEQLLGRPATLFAYPYGDFNGETKTLAKECGLACAVTVEEGTVSPDSDAFRLPRVSIDRSTTPLQFKGKISIAVDRYQALKN